MEKRTCATDDSELSWCLAERLGIKPCMQVPTVASEFPQVTRRPAIKLEEKDKQRLIHRGNQQGKGERRGGEKKRAERQKSVRLEHREDQ